MGKYKKRNYRAEQARKRRLEEKAYQEQAAKRKAWWAANGKMTGIIAAAALVVVIAVWLLLEYNVGMGGSIPTFFGNLVGVEDNWVVGNAADSGKSPRYYKMATFDAPEGYVRSEYSAHSDETVRDMYFVDESKEKLVQDIYVSHVQGHSGEQQIANLTMYLGDLTNSGAQKGVIAGKEADYIYVVFEDTAGGEGLSYAALCIYYETPYDAIVSVMVNSRSVAAEEVPSMETMLAEAETVLTGLKVTE